MKSKIFAWVTGGLFTLIVFFGGFASAFYLNYTSLGNTYTKEHVDNGRFMLWALKLLEEGETEIHQLEHFPYFLHQKHKFLLCPFLQLS